MAAESPRLSPLELLAGKSILLLGTTGFLAKLMLAMLLERFSVRRVYVLIRPTKSKTAKDRLLEEVLTSEVLAPIRRSFGDAFEALVAEQVEAIDGDLAKPNLGIAPEIHERLKRELDVVINSAGLVTFNPPLDSALEINAIGARNVAEFAMTLDRPRLVHISTCFVAGERSGRIREDTPIVGYFPKMEEYRGITFDWRREIEDLQRHIDQVEALKSDAALESTFKREALERLEKEGRETHERTVKAAVTNQRRRWMAEELIRRGLERAKHWGWPNIYTFTKALGEQAIADTKGLEWAIVRPAIVESTLAYPFPGWNEGMNTSAPLAYLGIHGQVAYPGSNDLILDLVPVDYVSSATIAAAAALIGGERRKVYQVATGDTNPASMARVITLVGLYKRRYWQRKADAGEIPQWKAELKMRSPPVPVSKTEYRRTGPPMMKALISKARGILDEMEPERYGPFGNVVSSARKLTREAETELEKVVGVFDMFLPFIWENKYVFLTRETRSLFERMNAADRALLPFDPEKIDWRAYWLEIHLPGLEKWVFPDLDSVGPKRIAIARDYRDLVEMFDSRTREHGRRVAFRILRKDDVADSFTYRDVRRSAVAVSELLASRGIAKGDRVALASESRPEWGMSYFGILLAGATVVPVDVDLSRAEMLNILRAAGVKAVIASPKLARILLALDNGAKADPCSFPVYELDEVFAKAHLVEDVPIRSVRKPEDPASIIYTSGTTGTPKGVILTDRNFTGLTARMSALFELRRTDAMLSVLPLHHTFEFSVGLLMPIASGASITYLEERTPDLLGRAFDETPVTSLVGVPAVWEALHRKIDGQLSSNRIVELAVRMLMRLNNLLRDRFGWNLGRWIFRRAHEGLGGRMRYLVSGGAPLAPEIIEDFRGLGFSIYEGYGLTEASPVLTVGWPGMSNPAGSVGWPLPGIEIRIAEPDEQGVGEVIARGPTIMQGYLDQPEATARAIREGWLHTGDRGRLDDEGRLFLVGREKDVIIDTSGKNVYPDEIEELYAGCPHVRQMSVVGIPADGGPGERVAALVVPSYDEGADREHVREQIREHFREIGSKLPFARRVKIMHIWEGDLPETSTRKVKRGFVRDQLVRLERTLQVSRQPSAAAADATEQRVRRAIAAIANKSEDEVGGSSRLVDGLGFDSLMQLELSTALEAEFPNAHITAEEMATVETVDHVVRLISRDRPSAGRGEEVGNREEAAPFQVPAPIAELGKRVLGWAQHFSYDKLLEVEVVGRGNIPANRNFIVASNHTSHLDMGLVKHALGEVGTDLATLAAKDYFFDDPVRRIYFENFTNLLPMDRHGSLKKSLRLAAEALRQGQSLLIFPEGTRARDGVMTSFKPAIGHLCINERIDIVPMYLGGTHASLPVGSVLPKQRELSVRIGHPITPDEMIRQTEGMSRSKAYRHVAMVTERAVRELGGLPIEAADDRSEAGELVESEIREP